MKIINKILFTTLITLLFSSFAQSQTEVKKVSISLYGSGNINWLKPDIDGKYGYTRTGVGLGYSAGVALDFALFNSNNYAFSTGISMLYYTAKLTNPDVYEPTLGFFIPGFVTTKYDMSYVNIPLLLKLKTNEIGYLTYYAEVGTSIGIKYKARADWNGNYNNGTYIESATAEGKDITNQTNLIRVPLVIGAGTEYNISGNTSIILGLVYNNGFTNFFAWGKNNPNIYDVTKEGAVLLDNNNAVILDSYGQPKKLGLKRKAISNFVGLKIGIKF